MIVKSIIFLFNIIIYSNAYLESDIIEDHSVTPLKCNKELLTKKGYDFNCDDLYLGSSCDNIICSEGYTGSTKGYATCRTDLTWDTTQVTGCTECKCKYPKKVIKGEGRSEYYNKISEGWDCNGKWIRYKLFFYKLSWVCKCKC